MLRLCFALFLAASSSTGGAQAATDEGRRITVVMNGDRAPYSCLSKDGKPQGELVDQWRAFEAATGIHVEIHAMNWSEALRRMRAGEFDVIDSVVRTPEREEFLDFTAPYANSTSSIYFRKNIAGLADLASAHGYLIGVEAGSSKIGRMRAAGLTELVLFPSHTELVKAASDSKVDVFILNDFTAMHLLTEAGVDDQFLHSEPVFRDELRRGVRRGDAAMLRTVTEGFAAVGPDELARIRKRWLGQPMEAYVPYLKYTATAVGLALLLIAFLLAWNRALRRGILLHTRALAESQLHFRQLAENVRDVFWVTTPSMDQLLYCSPTYERIWGRSLESLYAEPRSFMETIRPDASVGKGNDGGFDFEQGVDRPDGSARCVRIRGFPVPDEDGVVYRTVGICQDVTEQKDARERLGAAATELAGLSRRLVVLQESERKDLARELHDQVGQYLTALNINLSILGSELAEQASEPLRARLADSEVLVEATAAAVRNVVSGLRPPMLDDHGLIPALEWHAANFSRRTGLSIVVQGPEGAHGSAADSEIALFRIAQEALNNVAKHARATHVEIFIERAAGQYAMTIDDDGVGLGEADSGSGRGGLGIVTMRERAQAVGGTFGMQALSPRGTRLTVRVPAP